MNASTLNKSYDSRDYLLIANSYNIYTDLLVTRSLGGMENGGLNVKVPFGFRVRRSFLDK